MMVDLLAPLARDAVITRVGGERGCDPMDPGRAFSQAGLLATTVANPAHAFKTARGIAGKDGLVVVTGSSYLVGAVLPELGRKAR